MPKIARVVAGCAALVAASSGAGLVFNALRGESGVPVVASDGYYDNKVFVPCPEVLESPEPLEPSKVLKYDPDRILVVDARDAEAFAEGHHEHAVSFPYSVLFPPEPGEVKALADRAARRIIVVCGDPEIGSGELLAADLMTAGLTQVYYVKGGCPALVEATACRGPGR